MRPLQPTANDLRFKLIYIVKWLSIGVQNSSQGSQRKSDFETQIRLT